MRGVHFRKPISLFADVSCMNTITIGMHGHLYLAQSLIVRCKDTWLSLRAINHSLEWVPRDYKEITLFRQ